MIGFCLTDEQREFRDMAHRFAEKTIRPAAAEADEREEVPWDILQKAQQAGLITYPLPE
nr:acyl-CoA dehydrogenase family protein [Chloroflexota bacterium]